MSPSSAAATNYLPAQDIRRTAPGRELRIREGLEQWLHGWTGIWQRRGKRLRQWQATAAHATACMDRLANEPLSERHAALAEARDALRRTAAHTQLPPLDPDTLARLGLSASERLGLKPYTEQFVGVLGLLEGNLMEMATGEGKSLTLALAGVIAAWRGRPCHIVTANDYLARRDARNFSRFYAAHEVSVSAVHGNTEPEQRRKHYRADIVYCTAKELVADYLRDRLALGEQVDGTRRNLFAWMAGEQRAAAINAHMVQRGLSCVFVDEADHILIDEAATPLIISRQRENPLLKDAVRHAAALADTMQEGTHFRCHGQFRDVELLTAGEALVEDWARRTLPTGILRQAVWRSEWVRQALVARIYFERDRQYVIRDDKLILIDEGTGRQMPERSWRQGLHQAIEAKEGIPFTPSTEVLASISFQRFFRRIPLLGGVTGTAFVNRKEFWRVYQLPVFRVPTHRPVRRRIHSLQILPDTARKWQCVVGRIAALHRAGRPVLIGTRSIAASAALAQLLESRQLPFALLNAIHHESEAEIIANAGQPHRITIATNMAGRGCDIRLATPLDPQTVASPNHLAPTQDPSLADGLLVIATECHEARRIDLQLFGRCARQGEPGEVIPFAALDDEIFRRYLPRPATSVLDRALELRLPGSQFLARCAARFVQRRAEATLAKQRLNVLRQDRWLTESLSFSKQ